MNKKLSLLICLFTLTGSQIVLADGLHWGDTQSSDCKKVLTGRGTLWWFMNDGVKTAAVKGDKCPSVLKTGEPTMKVKNLTGSTVELVNGKTCDTTIKKCY